MRKILLSIYVLLQFTFLNVNAANLDWAWAKTLGGTGTDHISAITTDASGNVYVAGEFYGPSLVLNPTTSLTNTGTSISGNMYVAKYNAAGTLIWAKNGGGPGMNSGNIRSMAVDPAGNVYVCGRYQGFGLTFDNVVFNHATAGNYGFYIKLSASGAAMLNDDIQNADIMSIVVDANGIYIAGCFTQPSITLGITTITNPNPGSSEIFLAKVTGFSAAWTHTIGGSGEDIPTQICLDRTGGVFIAGSFNMTAIAGSTTLTSGGAEDVLIAKYDASGNFAWAKAVGGTRAEWVTGVTTDRNGNAYLSGVFLSPFITFAGNTISHSNGINGQNMFLLKYAADGTELWAETAGGPTINDDVVASAVSVDTADNIYLAGYSSISLSFGSISLIPAPNFLAKFDPAGTAIWGQSYGGLDVNHIKADNAGNVYLAGEYNLPVTFGRTTLTPLGDNDVWMAKMAAPAVPASVSRIESKQILNVYPNPTAKDITITGNWTQADIVITDMSGKVVYSTFSASPCKVNTMNLAAGNYHIMVSTKEGVANTKFTIAK